MRISSFLLQLCSQSKGAADVVLLPDHHQSSITMLKKRKLGLISVRPGARVRFSASCLHPETGLSAPRVPLANDLLRLPSLASRQRCHAHAAPPSPPIGRISPHTGVSSTSDPGGLLRSRVPLSPGRARQTLTETWRQEAGRRLIRERRGRDSEWQLQRGPSSSHR